MLGLGVLLMETSNVTNPHHSDSSSPASNGRFGVRLFPVLRFFQAPVSTVLEYSGIFRPRPSSYETESEPLVINHSNDSNSETGNNSGEISIRIIGDDGEQENVNDESTGQVGDESEGSGARVSVAQSSLAVESGDSNRDRDSSYQRYDIQQVARWIEQILPFSLLLLVVFIRQHLQGTTFDLPSLIHVFCCVDLMIYFKK